MPRLLALALALLLLAACEPGGASAPSAAGGSGSSEGSEAGGPAPAAEADAADEGSEGDDGGEAPAASGADDVGLEVVFLDVGQGEATLVRTGQATLLVDTGRHDRSDLPALLEQRDVTAIDVVAVTHPHADHVGQVDAVLDDLDVDEVWFSPADHDTQTFERALDALEAADVAYAEPAAGEVYDVADVTVEVLGPDEAADPGDLHDSGLVLRARAGDASVLLTGDVETATERRLVAGPHADWLDADLHQVGHHGSSTSTSPAFLDAVDPEVAVASYGLDNPYGHPHAEAVRRLEASGVALYGTGAHGRVTARHDADGWSVATERDGEVRPGEGQDDDDR
ncbi:MAG: ComEC/Rec2 family competence protein [Egibacteraceae bacterium]